jgi:hypothetical protein
MDPRRIELNRRHSLEMGALFAQFLEAHPDVESEVLGVEMTDAQDDAWTAFSHNLLGRHQAERAELAAEIETEQRQHVNVIGGRMDTAQAISMVADWIRSRGLDYPTEGLDADRFEAGWSVYAPVEVDDSDPMAFLDIPVGRSVFLIGDSGRIEEMSSSIPPQAAVDQFMARERPTDGS